MDDLEVKARQIIWEYLWSDTEVWALEEGIDRAAWHIRQTELAQLHEIAAVIGEGRVREIWAGVRDECRREMSDMAKRFVAADMVEDWLAGRMSRAPVPLEDWIYEWPDPPGAPPKPSEVATDPEPLVRQALGRHMRSIIFGFDPEALPDEGCP